MATTTDRPAQQEEFFDAPPIRYLTPDEGRAFFDEAAQHIMGMSGDEFLRRYDAGEFDDAIKGSGSEHLRLIRIEGLIPFAR